MRSSIGWLNRPVLAIAAVALLAAGLRFYDLDQPSSRVFDEVYYSKSGCVFVGFSNRRCDIRSNDEKYWVESKGETGSWVHPPLGKWAIGLGEKLVGTDALGWRISAATFGTLSVVLLAVIAQLLFGSPLWTLVAGLLLATENLNFVQSRVAMLDIFLTFWVVLGFLFVVLDRRWIDRRAPPPPEDAETPSEGEPTTPARVPSPILRPWRLAAGVALGAAFATKWSGLTAIAGAALISYVWDVTRNRRAGVRRPVWRTIQRESLGIVLAFVLVPALVYVASYARWFADHGLDLGQLLTGRGDWWKLQGDMASYHLHLTTVDPTTGKPVHPYLSHAWTWLLMWRPVSYFYKEVDGLRREILGMGNPAVFWGSLIAIPYLAAAWRRKRDWRAGFVLLAILSLYLPWLPVTRPQFFFYMAPITPFLALAVAYMLKDLSEAHLAGSRARPYLPIAVGFVIVSVGLFAFFWPILTASPLSAKAWQVRIWFPWNFDWFRSWFPSWSWV